MNASVLEADVLLEGLFRSGAEWASNCGREVVKMASLEDHQARLICNLVCGHILFDDQENADLEFIKQGKTLQINSEVSTADVLTALESGYTVVSNHFQKALRHTTGELLRKLNEGAFAGHVNVYWSPPNSSGAGLHEDDHHVLVVQAYGTKVWRFEAPEEEIELQRGEILFVPAHVAHDPRSCDCSSVHLTLGFDFDLTKEKSKRANANFISSAANLEVQVPFSDFIPEVDRLMRKRSNANGSLAKYWIDILAELIRRGDVGEVRSD